MAASKTCRICGIEKSLTDFHCATAMRDGHRNECKECFRELSSARYRADPERVKERVRQWQRDNPDRVSAQRRRYKADGRKAAVDRRSYLRRKFGISPEEYDVLRAAQGGVCAICGAAGRTDTSLHVDHDHRSGRIRKLLCFSCNAAIGHLRDDRKRLHRVIAYLDDHDPEVVELRGLAQERVAALRR
jgi:hypothetical protein